MNIIDLHPTKVVVIPSGCWIWIAARTAQGYGGVWYPPSGRVELAHRLSYVLSVGELDDDLQIDHLCRQRMCVNPLHLEQVTQKVNILRGHSAPALNAAKTRCPSGHPYDEENTYWSPAGHRLCRKCCVRHRLKRKIKRQAARSIESAECAERMHCGRN